MMPVAPAPLRVLENPCHWLGHQTTGSLPCERGVQPLVPERGYGTPAAAAGPACARHAPAPAPVPQSVLQLLVHATRLDSMAPDEAALRATPNGAEAPPHGRALLSQPWRVGLGAPTGIGPQLLKLTLAGPRAAGPGMYLWCVRCARALARDPGAVPQLLKIGWHETAVAAIREVAPDINQTALECAAAWVGLVCNLVVPDPRARLALLRAGAAPALVVALRAANARHGAEYAGEKRPLLHAIGVAACRAIAFLAAGSRACAAAIGRCPAVAVEVVRAMAPAPGLGRSADAGPTEMQRTAAHAAAGLGAAPGAMRDLLAAAGVVDAAVACLTAPPFAGVTKKPSPFEEELLCSAALHVLQVCAGGGRDACTPGGRSQDLMLLPRCARGADFGYIWGPSR